MCGVWVQGVLQQLLDMGVVSTLTEDLQWNIRMLLPRQVWARTRPLPCHAPSTTSHALQCPCGHTATHVLGTLGCASVYNSLRADRTFGGVTRYRAGGRLACGPTGSRRPPSLGHPRAATPGPAAP